MVFYVATIMAFVSICLEKTTGHESWETSVSTLTTNLVTVAFKCPDTVIGNRLHPVSKSQFETSSRKGL